MVDSAVCRTAPACVEQRTPRLKMWDNVQVQELLSTVSEETDIAEVYLKVGSCLVFLMDCVGMANGSSAHRCQERWLSTPWSLLFTRKRPQALMVHNPIWHAATVTGISVLRCASMSKLGSECSWMIWKFVSGVVQATCQHLQPCLRLWLQHRLQCQCHQCPRQWVAAMMLWCTLQTTRMCPSRPCLCWVRKWECSGDAAMLAPSKWVSHRWSLRAPVWRLDSLWAMLSSWGHSTRSRCVSWPVVVLCWYTNALHVSVCLCVRPCAFLCVLVSVSVSHYHSPSLFPCFSLSLRVSVLM